MLAEDKKVDEILMDSTTSNPDVKSLERSKNKKRNAIIGVSSAIAVVSVAVAMLLAPSGFMKTDALIEKP